MKTITICTTNISKIVIERLEKQGFKIKFPFPKHELIVNIEADDKLYQKITNDALLAQQIFDNVSYEQNELVNWLTGYAKAFSSIYEQRDPKISAKEWETNTQQKFNQIRNNICQKTDKEINHWKQVRQDRNVYIFKISFKISSQTFGVITSAVGVAGAAATGGISLGFGIYGLVKSVASLGKELYYLCKEFEEIDKRLKEGFDKLIKRYNTANKAKVNSYEMAKHVLTHVAVYEIDSISTCENLLEKFKGKLNGVEKKSHEFSTTLNELIDKQEEAKKKMRTIKLSGASGIFNNSSRNKISAVEAKLSKLEVYTNDQFIRVQNEFARTKKAREQEKKYNQLLEELQGKSSPKLIKAFDLLLTGVELTAGGFTTNWKDAGEIIMFVDGIGIEIDSILLDYA